MSVTVLPSSHVVAHSGPANRPGVKFRVVSEIKNTSPAHVANKVEIRAVLVVDGDRLPVSQTHTLGLESGETKQYPVLTSALERTRKDPPVLKEIKVVETDASGNEQVLAHRKF